MDTEEKIREILYEFASEIFGNAVDIDRNDIRIKSTVEEATWSIMELYE